MKPRTYTAKDVVVRVNGVELKPWWPEDTITMSYTPRCVICRRPLRSKVSLTRRMGPGCAKKNPALAEWYRNETLGQQRLPGIIMKPKEST